MIAQLKHLGFNLKYWLLLAITVGSNVIIALITVTGLLAGVLLGEVHMAAGMFIHELSVLIVILNGMRLLRSEPIKNRLP